MKAEEISDRMQHMHEVDWRDSQRDSAVGVCFWLAEIALQLAMHNEREARCTTTMEMRDA